MIPSAAAILGPILPPKSYSQFGRPSWPGAAVLSVSHGSRLPPATMRGHIIDFCTLRASHAAGVGSQRAGLQAMVVRHGLDHQRIFTTGLSVGGAMACAIFAGGAEATI